ncbi:MAG: Cna B-type domain-containing protein, partial [Kiritimatiellae bacterium]|nr:Cna B-type domain-containing protein [Kiritimatiellia bacterium]
DITNTYNTNTLGDILKVRKAVEVPDGNPAWTWGDDDKFVFGLFGVSNTAGVTQPMPSGSVYGDEVYKRIEVTKDSVNQEASVGEASVGAVSFDTPGTYVYCAREMTPAESGTPRLPGMTYDTEAYTVTAVVDSDMRISVTVTNKAGQTIAPVGDNVVTMPFTNWFDANKVAYAMAAGMVYVDPSKLDGDGRPLDVTSEVSGEFGFTMRPVGDNAAVAPMPSDEYSSDTECGLQGEGADRVYYAKNVNDRVAFEADAAHAIKFGAQQVGRTYAYELAEIIPDDARYIGDGFWYNDVNDTVYDGMVHTRTLTAERKNGVLTVTLDSSHSDKYLDPEKGMKYSDARNGKYRDAPASFYSSIYPRPTNDEPRFCNFKQPRIDVTATKVWDDADNQDGKRPANVYFFIERTDGQPLIDVYGNLSIDNKVSIAGADSSDSSLEAVWRNLPRYKRWDDGTYERLTYRVFESADGDPKRYSVPGYADQVITGDDEKGFTITNKRVPELRGVTVTKQWNDFDDRYHSRPEDVTFRLDQWKDGDSTPTDSDCRQPVVARANDGWKATWLDLPARYGDASKTYAYTLREDDVPDYRAGDFVEGKASMRVQIPAGVTPLTDKLMVSLTDNGVVTGVPIELTKANNWTGTFEGVLTQSGADGYARYGVTVHGSGTGVDDGDLQKTVIRNYTITNTKNPAAIPGLVYDGKPQALVSTGVATGGAFWYAP